LRFRLRLLFVLLVAAPLAALVVLGVWAARNERARGDSDVRAAMTRQLETVTATVDGAMSELERALLADTEAIPAADADAVRAYRRARPRLGRLLVLDARGQLRFPPVADGGPVSDDERHLIDDTRGLWEHGALANPASDERRSAGHGWLPAAASDGMGLLFWRNRPGGGRVAVLVPPAAVLELLVARLPATRAAAGTGAATTTAADDRIALHDPAGKLAYQWGAFEPAPRAQPVVTLALAAPLGGWRLAHMGPAPVPGGATFGIVAGLCALGAAITATGLWLYRESTRDLRLASQRVSFVNQVSHELKTPLTNIRMYAELLEQHVAAEDSDGRKRLNIVVTESQRLSRLIDNILTFSRQDKGLVRLRATPAVVDDVVADVIAQFAPGFATRGVTVAFQRGAPARVRVDTDALAQMLGNLLGNVEKYAPGGQLAIATAAAPPRTTITVADSGAGIPPADAERIFQPFVRLGAAAHEGVPGTGIGLAIARDLARLHGGDLRLLPAGPAADDARLPGARFQLTLLTESVT
jgi:signal transduction histidine kinase